MNPAENPSFLTKSRLIVKTWLKTPGFQRYSKNIGWGLLAKLTSLFVSFFVTIYVVRNLGPENYGMLSYAVSYVSIFSFIATIGIDQVLYRELVKYPDMANELMGTSFLIRLIAGCVAVILCVSTAFILASNDITFFLICVIAFTFIFNTAQLLNYEFQAKVEAQQLSILYMVTLLILNALKVLAIFTHKGVIYLAAILLLESILGAVSLIWLRSWRYGSLKNWRWSGSAAKLILRDSWPMIFAGAFAVIYARIDQVFIKHMIDTASVGLYDAAVRISEIWYFIPTLIVGTFFPAIMNAKSTSPEVYTKRLAQSALLLAGLSALVSIPVTFFAMQIMSIIYGPAFLLGTPVLQIYIWSSIPTALGSLVTSYLIAENLRKALFVSSCSTMILNIVLNILLIPHYGIVGSAWATFISYMAVPLSPLLFKVPRQQLMSVFRVKNVFHS